MNNVMLLSLGVAFAVTAIAIPFLLKISKRFSLYDHPDENRKNHPRKVSYLGGVGLSIGFVIALSVIGLSPVKQTEGALITGLGILGMFLIGLADDVYSLTPAVRFLFQFLIAGFLIYGGDLALPVDQLFPFFAEVPYFNFLMTVLIFSAITNSMNLIDGMDGLAGSLALVAVIGYSVLSFMASNTYALAIGMAFSGSLIGFLIYNKPTSKIFLGDSGSYLVGSFLSIFTLRFISGDDFPHYTVDERFQISFALMAVPCLDLVRLFLVRIWKGVSPFVADTSHIHHLLLSGGNSVARSLMLIILLQLFILALTILSLSLIHFVIYAALIFTAYLVLIRFLTKSAISNLEERIKRAAD